MVRRVKRSPPGGRSSWTPPGGLPPWTKRLLIANAAVFVLMFFQMLPSRWVIDYLALRPNEILTEPWTPLTHMFVHGGLGHFLINMLILFFFGPPLENRWGGREFVKFYLLCGLGGAAASFLLMPWVGTRPVVGASGALFGLLVAFAMLWPNRKLYIWGLLPVKAKWLVLFLALFSLYTTLTGQTGNVAEWAHLGGLITGFVYLKFFSGGSGGGFGGWGDFFKGSGGRGGSGSKRSSGGSRLSDLLD